MRILAVLALAAAVLAVPAPAAQVQPRALVLQRVDVPAGFRFDAAKSGVVSNAEARDSADPSFVARSGRTTGYLAQYFDRERNTGLQSSIDLFRGPGGARMMLARFRENWLRLAPSDPSSRARIGTEGWVFGGPVDTLVFWRYGRAFALVLGVNVNKQQTLALARKQQRRIAAGLG